MDAKLFWVVTLFLTLNSLSIEGKMLERLFVRNARTRGAICNDNSEALYYLHQMPSETRWIIYLESGGACSNIKTCNWRYKNFFHLMSSSLYPENIHGMDLMSPISKDNPHFHRFNKVIIPYCSSDLWLGSVTKTGHGVNGTFVFHDDHLLNDFSYQGSTIFRSVVEDLKSKGLENASEILLSGSSAGGIGVVNHLNWFRSQFPNVLVKSLIDSSWLVNFDQGLTNMVDFDFIKITKMDDIPACRDRFFGYPCCSSIECMIIRGHMKSDVDLFFLFSFYDSFLLKFDKEVVQTAQSLKMIDLLRKLSSLRAQLDISSDTIRHNANISYVIAACFQHHFIATSSLWKPGHLLHKTFQKSEDVIQYTHSIQPGIWSQTKVGNQSVRESIAKWYVQNVTLRLEDNCLGAQCNPTCTSGISYQAKPSSMPVEGRITLVAVCAFFVLLCLVMKAYFVWRYLDVTKKQREYIDDMGDVIDILLNCDLPAEAPKDAIGLSCLNLTYEIPRKSQTAERTESCQTIASIDTDTKTDVELQSNGRSAGLDSSKKRILNGVSAYFNPGQLVGVMGPSGCGKTTFLDLLAGRRHNGIQQGTIFINGLPACHMREWSKARTGYVLQLAIPFYEQLTVRENLTYSALLRLPSSNALKVDFEKIEEVISQTGLEKKADLKVGGLSGPGLSGGEKRRLCVANQLLDSPSLLLMDEPTSGLDAAASLELLQLLHRLAVAGKLVILTIHQPRSEIFHMFDTVLFLCRGQVAYFGSPLMSPRVVLEAIHQADMDDRLMDKGNPADVILDFLNQPDLQTTILDYYQSTGEVQSIKNAITVATKEATPPKGTETQRSNASFVNRMFAWECRAASSQTFWQNSYLPMVFVTCGIVLSTVYWKTDTGITMLASLIVFVCFSQLFMASVVHSLMSNSVKMFNLESLDGIGTPIELILQVFMRVTAISTFPVIVCTVIVYFSIVAVYYLKDLFLVILIAVLLNQTWSGILIFVNSCTIRYSPMITQFIAAVAGFSGGFLVPRPKMPVYYSWIFYINPTQWAFASISKIILLHTTFPCKYSSPLECQSEKGLVVLQQFELLAMDPFQAIIVLLLMLVTALLLSVVVLALKISRKESKMSLKHLLRKMTGRTKDNFQSLGKQAYVKDTVLQNYTSPEHMLKSMQNGIALRENSPRENGSLDHHTLDDVFFSERELQAKYMDFETHRHAVFVANSAIGRGRQRMESDSDSCSSRYRKISKVSPGRISVSDASIEILKERSISFQTEAHDVVHTFDKVVEDAMRVKRTGRKWKEKVGRRRHSQSANDGSFQNPHQSALHSVILEVQDEEAHASDMDEKQQESSE